MTLCGVGERLPQTETANAGIHLVFGHVDTDDNEIVLCHHPLPSLLGSGSKPLQLFGLRKTTGAVPRSDQQALPPLGRNGLSSSDGRFCENRPFAHSGRFCGHKGRFAIVTNAGRDAVDAKVFERRTAWRGREVAASRYPDAGITAQRAQARCSASDEASPRAEVANKPGAPGRPRISRKPVAQGRPGCLGRTCGSAACFFVARGPWERRAPGLPCALRFEG